MFRVMNRIQMLEENMTRSKREVKRKEDTRVCVPGKPTMKIENIARKKRGV